MVYCLLFTEMIYEDKEVWQAFYFSKLWTCSTDRRIGSNRGGKFIDLLQSVIKIQNISAENAIKSN